MERPLQNRVSPFGEILARPERGEMFGNRGGRIHDPLTQRLSRRRWASKAWICCVLSFKGRARQVMGPGYTELFFLDEATALAAGHRPCFECRRADATAFAAAWARAQGLAAPPRAPAMDDVLHAQRRGARARARAEDLPAGVLFFDEADAVFLKREADVLPWGWDGYGRPRAAPGGEVGVLTPSAVADALAAGFRPRLHPSASG
ncbi:MAG: hypothetical protein AAF192_15035 [Pseudomonadota bacterium]